jgi:uncharacterized protein (DUF488 family)
MSDLLTVGHSSIELSRFVTLLREPGIEVLVDVRSHPHSRFAPQFNREVLERALPAAGVKYTFGGRELGGRPEDPSCYDHEGHVLYGRQARTASFLEGLNYLERVAGRSLTAVMCSEEDPVGCHRHLLIARVLADHGWEIQHLRGNGGLQSYASMADVRSRGHRQESLFPDSETGEDRSWRSVRSVSPSEAPRTSSAH